MRDQILEKMLRQIDSVSDAALDACVEQLSNVSELDCDISLSELLLERGTLDEEQLLQLQKIIEERYKDHPQSSSITDLVPLRVKYPAIKERDVLDIALDHLLITRDQYQHIQSLQDQLKERGIEKPEGELLIQETDVSIQELLDLVPEIEEQVIEKPEDISGRSVDKKSTADQDKEDIEVFSREERKKETEKEKKTEKGKVEEKMESFISELSREDEGQQEERNYEFLYEGKTLLGFFVFGLLAAGTYVVLLQLTSPEDTTDESKKTREKTIKEEVSWKEVTPYPAEEEPLIKRYAGGYQKKRRVRFLSVLMSLEAGFGRFFLGVPAEDRRDLLKDTLLSLRRRNSVLPEKLFQQLSFSLEKAPSPYSYPGLRELSDPLRSHHAQESTKLSFVRILSRNVNNILSDFRNRRTVSQDSLPPKNIISSQKVLKAIFRRFARMADESERLEKRVGESLRSMVVREGQDGNISGSIWGTWVMQELFSLRRLEKLTGVSTDEVSKSMNQVAKQYSDPSLFVVQKNESDASSLVESFQRFIRENQQEKAHHLLYMMGTPGWGNEIRRDIFRPEILESLEGLKGKDVREKKTVIRGLVVYTILTGNRSFYVNHVREVILQAPEVLLDDQLKKEIVRRFGDLAVFPAFTSENKNNEEDTGQEQKIISPAVFRKWFGKIDGHPLVFHFPRSSLHYSMKLLRQEANLQFEVTQDVVDAIVLSLHRSAARPRLDQFSRFLRKHGSSDLRNDIVNHILLWIHTISGKRNPIKQILQLPLPQQQRVRLLRKFSILMEALSDGAIKYFWNRILQTDRIFEKKSIRDQTRRYFFKGFYMTFPVRAESFLLKNLNTLTASEKTDWLKRMIQREGLYKVADRILQYEEVPEGILLQSSNGESEEDETMNTQPDFVEWEQSIIAHLYKPIKDRIGGEKTPSSLKWLSEADHWGKWLQFAMTHHPDQGEKPSYRRLARHLLHPFEMFLVLSGRSESDNRSLSYKNWNDWSVLWKLYRHMETNTKISVEIIEDGSKQKLDSGDQYPGLSARVRKNIKIIQGRQWNIRIGNHSYRVEGDLIRVPDSPINPGSPWKAFRLQRKK